MGPWSLVGPHSFSELPKTFSRLQPESHFQWPPKPTGFSRWSFSSGTCFAFIEPRGV